MSYFALKLVSDKAAFAMSRVKNGYEVRCQILMVKAVILNESYKIRAINYDISGLKWTPISDSIIQSDFKLKNAYCVTESSCTTWRWQTF